MQPVTMTLPFSFIACADRGERFRLGAVEEAAGVDDDRVGAGVAARELVALGAQPREDALAVDERLRAAERDEGNARRGALLQGGRMSVTRVDCHERAGQRQGHASAAFPAIGRVVRRTWGRLILLGRPIRGAAWPLGRRACRRDKRAIGCSAWPRPYCRLSPIGVTCDAQILLIVGSICREYRSNGGKAFAKAFPQPARQSSDRHGSRWRRAEDRITMLFCTHVLLRRRCTRRVSRRSIA